LKHKKEKKKNKMTYRLRQGAEGLSLAQEPQMAAPWPKETAHISVPKKQIMGPYKYLSILNILFDNSNSF
jgi:hypothetical protein